MTLNAHGFSDIFAAFTRFPATFYFARLLFGKDNVRKHRSAKASVFSWKIPLTVGNVFLTRDVLKIFKSRISPVTVLVIDLFTFWARPNKCAGHKAVHGIEFWLPIFAKSNKWVANRHNSWFENSFSFGPISSKALNPAHVADMVEGFVFCNRLPSFHY